MFRLSSSNLLAKKLRLLTTAFAIVLGVAFTAGTMILADTMTTSFSSTLDDIASGADTVVRGERLAGTGDAGPRAPLPLAVLDTVRAVDGVAAAAPYWDGYAQVVVGDGKALDTTQSVGLNWIDDDDLTMFELVEGRAPAAGEIVVGAGTAQDAHLRIGDTADVITMQGQRRFTIVGLARLEGGAELGDTAFTFFADTDAATHLGTPGGVDEVLARADGDVDEATVTSAIARAVPDAEVVTGSARAADEKAEVSGLIGVFEKILLAFGIIALLVGSFTIANTFTITVAQRTQELALLRAVGASRRQVMGSVVLEAVVLGAIAAALGLVAALGVATGLTSLFAAVGLEFPSRALVVEPSTVVVAFAAGVVVTVLAALVPAGRASSVAPVEAMQGALVEPAGTPRRRVALGVVLAAGGATALAAGVTRGDAGLVGIGGVATFLASITLGPVLVRPVTAVLTAPMRRMGAAGRLAAANAVRNPRRSAATAAALTVGVMLVAGAAMFASTARATILGDTTDVIVADRVVRPAGAIPGLPTDVAARLADVEGLQALPVQTTKAAVGGEVVDVGGLDLSRASGLVDVKVVAGSIESSPDQLVVGAREAEANGWQLGHPVEVTFADGSTVALNVGAVVEQGSALPSMVAPYDVVADHGDGLDRLVLLRGDRAALAAAEAALAPVASALLETVDAYAASQAGALDMLLTLVIGFLGLAVVIAVLGIATTIGLSVHERTRELGVLRAVGMGRGQLRRSIRLESIVLALFGTVVGLALGIGLTWAVLTTLEAEGFVAPVLPTGTLVAVTVGALLAGTLAAAFPARRAARRPVLDAIRTA
jgi:putative ABC transport system permease protein